MAHILRVLSVRPENSDELASRAFVRWAGAILKLKYWTR